MWQKYFNPLLYSDEHGLRETFGQNFNFKIRRDNQKISYVCCVYESEDINSLS